MLGADVVIDASNPVLGKTPESFESVHVRIAFDVDARGMIDAAVLITEMRQRAVDARLIGEDNAARHDSFADVRQESVSRNVRDNAHGHAALALYGTPHGRFACWSSGIADQSLVPMFVLFFPP